MLPLINRTVNINNVRTFQVLPKHLEKPQSTVSSQLSPDAVHARVSAAVIQILDLRVLYGGTVLAYLSQRLSDADHVSVFTEEVLDVLGRSEDRPRDVIADSGKGDFESIQGWRSTISWFCL